MDARRPSARAIYFACSFQKTSSVILDLATQINPDARFFYLDTDVLFPETYETRDRLAAHFGVEFDRYHNITHRRAGRPLRRRALEARPRRLLRPAQGRADAPCPGVRRLLGLRHPPRATRAPASGAPKFAWDKRFGLWKLNPLADWTERDVWNYIREHAHPVQPAPRSRLPVDRLHPLHPAASPRAPRRATAAGSARRSRSAGSTEPLSAARLILSAAASARSILARCCFEPSQSTKA